MASLGLSGQAWAIRFLQCEQGAPSRGSSAESSCTRVVCSVPLVLAARSSVPL